MNGRVWVRRLTVLGLIAALIALGLRFPPGAALLDMVERVRGAGALGLLGFIVFYFIFSVLMLPASWVQGAAGFLYGPWFGIPLASALSTLSALLGFLLARTLLRDAVERRFANDLRFRAIDGAVEEGGARLVALLRISPLSPYNVVSYFLGATRVRPLDFALGTFLGGMLPVFLFGYLGSSLEDLAELLDGRATAQAGLLEAVGLVVTLVATAIVTHYARKVLHTALKQPRQKPAEQ